MTNERLAAVLLSKELKIEFCVVGFLTSQLPFDWHSFLNKSKTCHVMHLNQSQARFYVQGVVKWLTCVRMEYIICKYI